MRLSLPISVSLALFVWQNAVAQLAPADDFFNGGAQFYISNNIPSALERVETGRKFYPDDEKLKKLEELLKQQQQSQQQQNQSQQQKSRDQKNQQQQNQSSPQKNLEDQQKQADQKKGEEQKQPAQQKADGDKQDKPDGEQPTGALGQMTPEEAKRLLDAQKGDEQLLQLKPAEKPPDASRHVKDW